MAVTLSRNLKLRIDSNLTANAKYNLERIDLLGATFLVDTTNTLNLRSQTDIVIEPESADLDGSGVGGTVSIGTPSHSIAELAVYADEFSISTELGLADQATGGNKDLLLSYKSDINGSVDTASNRALRIDVDGADRNLVLGGSLSVLSGDLTLNLSGTTSLSLPLSGTLSTLSGAESLTNKIIDATQNTISNISNASIAASAGIVYSKLNLSGSITNSDVSPSAAVAYSKLALTGSIVDADISPSASVARSKIAAGSPNQIVINDGAGNLSSESALATSRGGTGVSGSATFPTTGVVLSDSNSVTVTNKTISGASNTLTGIQYGSLVLNNAITNSDISGSAGISYSKLNLAGSIANSDISAVAGIAYSKLTLTNSIQNTDISSSAAIAYSKLNLSGSISNADIATNAAIAGTKISPDFGNQLIRSLMGIQFEEGGWKTTLQAAQGGQSSDITFSLPTTEGINGQVLTTNGSGELDWLTVTGTGTVTSVDLSGPAEFTTSGGPITSAGTLSFDFADEPANFVLAGPQTGPDDRPTFRALASQDLPSGIDATKIGGGSVDNTEFSYLDGVTSAIQTQINGKQPLDATLTALAAYNTNGLITQTAANTFTGRTLQAGSGISIANGDGVSNDPTISSTITQYTDEMAQDAVGTILADTSSINLTYSDSTPSIAADVIPGGVDHNLLLNYVANQHVDHSTVSINTAANSGLSGGGNITASRSLVIDPTNAPSITVASGDIVLVADVSNSNALSRTTAQAIADLATAPSFKQNWLNADGTTLVVTHSLGTTDVMVQLYDNSDGQTIYADTVIRTDTNTVTLTSSQAPAVSWRVMILAV